MCPEGTYSPAGSFVCIECTTCQNGYAGRGRTRDGCPGLERTPCVAGSEVDTVARDGCDNPRTNSWNWNSRCDNDCECQSGDCGHDDHPRHGVPGQYNANDYGTCAWR